MLRRVDRLVHELEIGATIEQADGDLLLDAAELVWTEDPGRSGPHALIPALRAAADRDYNNGVLTAVYYPCAASAPVAWHDKIVNLPELCE